MRRNADNCSGQNKNNFFLWYLAWRIMMNLHNTILNSFLIAGHTKFGPDHCFGRIKKSYKLTYVSSIYELASLVEKSSTTGNNKAQIVGTHDGRVIVPVYDWASFLEPYFKKIPNIKKYHHFRSSKATPAIAFCKELVTSPEQPFMLLIKRISLLLLFFHLRSGPMVSHKSVRTTCSGRYANFVNLVQRT